MSVNHLQEELGETEVVREMNCPRCVKCTISGRYATRLRMAGKRSGPVNDAQSHRDVDMGGVEAGTVQLVTVRPRCLALSSTRTLSRRQPLDLRCSR
ncbi:hypothetical protein EXIGLDRAFT_39366 [Exidia glandulosa HHB12029]|uniref:Uncharacterized protein n=1 Tax=Exidia glandulosa HHB12029 TaxID=1314781 RepID=A0A165INC1_EXIGL|nr:hypothetical protein EXIGLDRAFT_39366 [Exidia glandulosa HHB12029]